MRAEDRIRSLADEEKAKRLAGFFKTGIGEYSYGDRFLGVTVPQIRKVMKEYKNIPLSEVEIILKSPYHEVRMFGTLVLAGQFDKRPDEIFAFYLANINAFNNWDLVDVSAPGIVGEYIWRTEYSDKHADQDKYLSPCLLELAGSQSLWEQRIAMVSTLGLMRHGIIEPTFALALHFMEHPHDLMRKATGWMLREAGKRNILRLKTFLDANAPRMPRTMLRYAIEKFEKDDYRHYLNYGKTLQTSYSNYSAHDSQSCK